MDQSDDPRELERKIEQATRMASRVTDQTTVERLRAWVEDLKRKLQQRREARRTKQATGARAHELWEQSGRPSGRALEFWASSRVRDQRGRSEIIGVSVGRPRRVPECLDVSIQLP